MTDHGSSGLGFFTCSAQSGRLGKTPCTFATAGTNGPLAETISSCFKIQFRCVIAVIVFRFFQLFSGWREMIFEIGINCAPYKWSWEWARYVDNVIHTDLPPYISLTRKTNSTDARNLFHRFSLYFFTINLLRWISCEIVSHKMKSYCFEWVRMIQWVNEWVRALYATYDV